MLDVTKYEDKVVAQKRYKGRLVTITLDRRAFVGSITVEDKYTKPIGSVGELKLELQAVKYLVARGVL